MPANTIVAACACALLSLTINFAWHSAAYAAQTPAEDEATLGLSELDTDTPGYTLYAANCAHCHDQGVSRAPPTRMLQFMSASTVYKTLKDGVMAPLAAKLSKAEKREIAEFVTHDSLDRKSKTPKAPRCEDKEFDFSQAPSALNWGLTWGNKRSVPAAVANIGRNDLANLKLKWAFAFPLAQRARSHPLVAGGAVFTGSQDGTVYALDQATGCVRWTFQARNEVRTGIAITPWQPGDTKAQPRLYFGDLIGNLYAVDAATGSLVWTAHPDDHPAATITAAPTLYEGKLYAPVSSLEVVSATDPNYECCSFRGSVAAYDAATGELLWQTYTITEELAQQRLNSAGTRNFGPSGAPIWNSPAIDPKRNQLYIGTGENYSSPATTTSDAIIAMDLTTGKINWSYQATANDAWNSACGRNKGANCPAEDGPDFDFGAAMVLAEASDGSEYVIGPQKSGVVHALNPDDGTLQWQTKLGRGGLHGGVHFGIAADADRVFVPISDARDTRPHDEPANPGLFAVDLRSGKLLWQAPLIDECQSRQYCDVGIGAAITTTPDLVFAGALDGYLRIHDAHTGQLLRKLDTTQSVITVSGATAHGGSMDGGTAPLPHHGHLYVNSGYNFAGHMAGNVLLVYEIAPPQLAEPQPSED